MTWTKLGDEFLPESAELSDAAYRTHTEALQWSSFRLLDLRIPKRDLKRFAETRGDLAGAVAELIAMSWWTDEGDHYWIGMRFPEWQRDRLQVVHRREKNAEAQRRKRRHDLGDHGMCLASCKRPSADDSPDDPGRGGAGRVGKPTTNLFTDEQGSGSGSVPAEDDWPTAAQPGHGADHLAVTS